jgi:hypothetical protein
MLDLLVAGAGSDFIVASVDGNAFADVQIPWRMLPPKAGHAGVGDLYNDPHVESPLRKSIRQIKRGICWVNALHPLLGPVKTLEAE